MDQLYTLSWGNHKDTLLTLFSNLFSNEKLVDVTLVAEGKRIEGHKLVLSACSSYFEDIFAQCGDRHPIVFLKDIKYNELQNIVSFMYNGEVSVAQDDLPSLIAAANSLKVRGLAGENDAVPIQTEKNASCSEERFYNHNMQENQINATESNSMTMENYNSELNPDSCCSVELVTGNTYPDSERQLDILSVNENPLSQDTIIKQEYQSVRPTVSQSECSYEYNHAKRSLSTDDYKTANPVAQDSNKDNFNGANPNVDPKSWTCDTCGKSFEKWCQLYHHRNLECAAKSKVPCPLCLRQFNKTERMLYHLKRIHGKVPS